MKIRITPRLLSSLSSLALSTLVLSGTLALTSACTPQPRLGKSRAISALETQGLLRNDFAVLIDVRDVSAIRASGKPPRSIALPITELESAQRTLPKDKTLVVLGESAEQAKQASEKLALLGFQAGHLGTLTDWKQAGGTVEGP